MWRRNAFVVAFLLAQEMATSSSGQQRPVAGLLSQAQWIRFEIVLGRITAVTLSCGPTHCEGPAGADGAVRELLSFNGDAALPALVYESQDSQQSLRISVTNRTQVIILREPAPGSQLTPVRFTQSSWGKVSLVVGQGSGQRSHDAASLWHLLLTAPEDSQEHLLPLLNVLRADWRLEDAIAHVETALCRVAANSLPKQPVAELVARLDDPSFPRRQAADRALRGLGLSALAHLESLDRSRLTGEQRLRVRKLCEELRCATPDTPDRVATWLASDESVWSAWLSHGDGTRRLAAEWGLAAIRGQAPPALDRTRLAQLPDRQRD